jgi:hypothetical protein
VGIPTSNARPIGPDVFDVSRLLDGLAPDVQTRMQFPRMQFPEMHFPQTHFPSTLGADVALSGAPRPVAPGATVPKPRVGIRSTDDTSVRARSPAEA